MTQARVLDDAVESVKVNLVNKQPLVSPALFQQPIPPSSAGEFRILPSVCDPDGAESFHEMNLPRDRAEQTSDQSQVKGRHRRPRRQSISLDWMRLSRSRIMRHAPLQVAIFSLVQVYTFTFSLVGISRSSGKPVSNFIGEDAIFRRKARTQSIQPLLMQPPFATLMSACLELLFPIEMNDCRFCSIKF